MFNPFRERSNPPCANCGKENGGFMGSSAWGHNFSCCSDACGKRLAKRLENGMITREHILEKTRQNEFHPLLEIQEDSNKDLRLRIKHLENQLKQAGIKPKKYPVQEIIEIDERVIPCCSCKLVECVGCEYD